MNTADFSRWIVTFSGGKDSVATWLYLRSLGLEVTCVFADTGHESEVTYRYLDHLEKDHGLPLVRVYPRVKHIWKDQPPKWVPEAQHDDIIDMGALIARKGRPPSPTARFCTTILKLRPVLDYLPTHGANFGRFALASGVRAEESTKRERMPTWEYDGFMEQWRWLPIHAWPVSDVFAIHEQYGVPPNPLYLQGCSRVGCWPCIFARKDELAIIARDKSAVGRLKKIEADTGQTFFSPGKPSKAYHSKIDPKTKTRICTAEDVFRWALGAQPDWQEGTLFAAEEPVALDYGDDWGEVCNSVYGLCE